MSDSFQTVGAPLEHEPDKVKGSRHIANVFPVTSHQEIDSCIKSVRARMPDANHHAYAWRLGRGDNDFRYSDDGEPSGSAGRPILKHIDGRDVTDVLVVVTRYFGGTKLGTGGLVRAYGGAAQEALDLADVVEVIPQATFQIQHAYEDSGAIASILTAYDLQASQSNYGAQVEIEILVPQVQADDFERDLRDATAARARIRVTKSDRA